MDVRLPDGTVISNVPDGTTQSDLMARVAKLRPNAAEQIASDPITKQAKSTLAATPAELIAGSAPGRFLLEPARGLLELGSHLSPVAGMREPMGEAARSTGELIKHGREAYGDTGVDIAGIAGQVASPAVLGAAKLIPAGAKLLPKILGNAAVGATAGATTPTEGTGDFVKEKALQTGTGAAFGSALPVAGSLVRGLGKTIYSAFEPIVPGGAEAILNRFQTELLGPAKEKVIAALQSARELVPGSKPTAGEAVASLPEATALASHQRAVSRSPAASTGFMTREAQQEAARAGELGKVSGTPEKLASAESARSAQAASDYEAAFAETVKRDKELGSLMKDPFFKAALPAARDLAKSKGITAKDDLTQFLDYVKVGLDKQLSRTGDTALAGKEKEAVQSVKTRLLAWMDEKNPAYAAARENFAAASKPINQMQAGQYLGQKLQSPVGHVERAGIFGQAVRDAEGTMEKATGFSGPLPEPLRKVADAIAGDLSRKAQYERLARGTNLSGTSMTPESPLPNLLSRPAMVANFVARKLGHDLEGRVNEVAGKQYLDPQALAASLMDKPLSQRKALIDALMSQIGSPVVVGGPSAAVAQRY